MLRLRHRFGEVYRSDRTTVKMSFSHYFCASNFSYRTYVASGKSWVQPSWFTKYWVWLVHFQFTGVKAFTVSPVAEEYSGESDTLHRRRSHHAGRFGTSSRNGRFQAICRISFFFDNFFSLRRKWQKWFRMIFENRWNRTSTSRYRIICRRACTKETKRWPSICGMRTFANAACTPKRPNTSSCNTCKRWKNTACICIARHGCVWRKKKYAKLLTTSTKHILMFLRLQNFEGNVTHDVYVAISLSGIAIFERCSRINAESRMESGANSRNKFQRKLYANFDWLEIDNLCFSKHALCVVVRKLESLKAKDNNKVKYKFKMDGRKWVWDFFGSDWLTKSALNFLWLRPEQELLCV